MSKIPYRAIPISLENDPTWLKLSLKRRALFLFLVRESVSIESYSYKGKILTFGQYVWSYNKLLERFNQTLISEDQYSKMGCHSAIKFFIKEGLVKAEKWGTSVHAETLITILHTDCYELLKNKQCTTLSEECTTSVQHSNYLSVQPNEDEKPVEDDTKAVKPKTEKTSSVQPGISLNNEECTTKQDLTESTLKTVFRKDNVRTVPLSSSKGDNEDIVKKFKIQDEQAEIFNWLNSEKIDSPITTLCYWAKTYSMKRLKEVHKAAVMAKPKYKGKDKSIGALMNHLLKNEIPVETNSKSENIAFMDGFMDREPLMNWKIEKKYVSCEIKGIRKEIFLDIHPQSFVDQLIMLENQFKESKNV
jgi:hypothetical protein